MSGKIIEFPEMLNGVTQNNIRQQQQNTSHLCNMDDDVEFFKSILPSFHVFHVVAYT